MIKLVVFDWNGTLLADTLAVLEGNNRCLAILGQPPLTLREYQEKRDVPIIKFYKNLGLEKQYETHCYEMTKAFHAFYEPRVAKARTRTGTRQVLETLAQKKITSIILSNHTVEGIYLQLERLKLTHYFAEILANDNIQTVNSTGKQQHLHDYLERQKFNPSEMAIIGDTVEEVEIGQSLGLRTIAITGGYNSAARLKALKPDVLIHSLHEIIPAIEEF